MQRTLTRAATPVCADGARLHEWRECVSAAYTAEWDALAAIASEPNPFFESWYLQPSLEALDPHGDVQILAVGHGDKLVGLMPVERTLRYYSYPLPNISNWTHPNCFLGSPLVARGQETAFWTALLAWADERPRGGLFLHLQHIPLEGALIDALREVIAVDARPSALVHREQRAMLASPLSAEDYFAQSMSGKKRKELRRQHKRLSELGELAITRQSDEMDVGAWVADFLALELSGWKGKAGSALAAASETNQLFTQALTTAALRGQLERLAITLDGRPIAMLANLISGAGSFSYKTAFDEDYARFSPGVLLQRENLAMLDSDGTEWADSCASADHPMIDRIWRERRAIGRVSIGIGGSLRQSIFRQLAKHEIGREPDGIGS